MAGPDVAVDCRWLGYTGVGRVTAALLDGLGADPPPTWVLWGPAGAAHRCWPGAPVVDTATSPLALAGQRSILQVPKAGVVVYPHAVRPLDVWRRAAVLVHDVIPANHGAAARRRAWGAFFRASAHGAARVMVYSSATAEQVVGRLGVSEAKVRHIPIPLDEGLVARVRARRDTGARTAPRQMLYVGQAKPHKNLPRALSAFARSRFRADGGGFTIVGPRPEQCEALRQQADALAPGQVTIVPRCDEERLVAEMAGAAFVILPSLEEGYGLPVAEALAAGIPACCSGEGALLEAARGFAEVFDPRDVGSMAEVIDVTARLDGSGAWSARDLAHAALPRPSALDLALAVRAVAAEIR